MSLTFISLRLVLCAIELLPFAESRPEQAAAASSVNSQKITTQAQVRSLKPQILGPFGDAAFAFAFTGLTQLESPHIIVPDRRWLRHHGSVRQHYAYPGKFNGYA
ncbi:hypothetical protein CN204_22310 [Sinorhizobium meliloti]|uniref:Uncharacterized protein n=1 Tax=Sinorhizobium meliloti (strain SM11) TaxID=707241 RepID=F7XBX5_SINMM|nr:hypothetical protein SM11_pC1489 [Sinorhizobium meliloti SM11]ARS67738.1 hypothetical protein SMRU11_10570 [Sinorhizobium meliloti RU11/001]ASP67610.1 hypothetical protein CDO29_18230 [Sinorhizobium meliloti]RVG64147.1 hypothetical protein CN222_18590 [Sinorhizobium meliloti]RVG86788.1 hypothetical protein CN221_29985 [Sinorhizobium meliloti]